MAADKPGPVVVPYMEARADVGNNSSVSEYDTDILLWSEQQAALLRRLCDKTPSAAEACSRRI